MIDASEAKKQGYDVYDYVFSLEEQVRGFQTEKQVTSARITQLQLELERMRRELNELKNPPLLVGTIHEVLPDNSVIVKHSNGMEFLVKPMQGTESALESGKRVAMNQRSLMITQVLPDNKDWRVNAMEIIEKPKVTFESIGGLEKEILEIEEAVILPLTQPKSFEEIGIEPPNGVLLYGPPGTGKTLLAKAVANKTNSTFTSLSCSVLVRKYIGEGAKLVRDLFRLAKEKKPAIIFIDEIDSVGTHRFATANGDREVQRTMMQVRAEMDGLHEVKGVKVIAATNRIDMLDPALLRPGRFDRVIEVPLPDTGARKRILEIHAGKMSLDKKIDLNEIAALMEGFTGADIRAVCTEAGMFTLRSNRNKVTLKDFSEAVQKITRQPQAEDRPNEKMLA